MGEQEVKEDVLARANGTCENERCSNELGDNFRFLFTKSRMMHSDYVVVVCYKCYKRRRSIRSKIS